MGTSRAGSVVAAGLHDEMRHAPGRGVDHHVGQLAECVVGATDRAAKVEPHDGYVATSSMRWRTRAAGDGGPALSRALGGDVDVGGGDLRGLGHGLAALLEPFDVEGDGVAHLGFDVLARGAGGDAARQVGRVGGVVGAVAALDHDQVSPLGHRSSFNPACLTMLAQVLGCKVSDGLPAIVTRPGRSGCRYWRWLPRVRASSQPAASMRLIASLTLTGTRAPYDGRRTFSAVPGAARTYPAHPAQPRRRQSSAARQGRAAGEPRSGVLDGRRPAELPVVADASGAAGPR